MGVMLISSYGSLSPVDLHCSACAQPLLGQSADVLIGKDAHVGHHFLDARAEVVVAPKSAGMATARPATVATSAAAMPGAMALTLTSPATRSPRT